MKSLFKNVVVILIFSIITRFIGFFFRIYLSRTIGSVALGQYQVSFSVFMVLLTIVASGLPFVISRLTAGFIAKGDKKSEAKIVSAGLIIGLVLSGLLCLLVVLFIPVLKHIFADEICITLLLILLPALVFSSVYSVIRGNIWGHNNYFVLSMTELFEQVVRVIIFVILISGVLGFKNGAVISSVSMSVACLLSSALVVVIYLCKGGKFSFKKNRPMYKELIKKSAPITGVRIAGSLIQPLIALIIPLRLVSAGYTSAQALALYGVAMGMTIPFLYIPSTITGSLSTALVPDLSSALVKNDMTYIKNRIISAIKITIFISVLFIPLYIGAGEVVGEFFYDNVTSGVLLAKSAWIMLPLGLTNISSSLLNSLGYEVKSLKNYVLGAIILILSIWFLPKYIGIDALIWGFGILFSIASVLNIRMLKRIVGQKLNISKFLIFSVLFIIPSASICSLLCNLCVNFMPKFFALAISCSVGCLFYVALCFVFNLLEFNAVKVWVKNKVNKKFFKRKKKKRRVAN